MSFLLKGMALSGVFMLILSIVIFVLIMASKKAEVAAEGDSDFLINIRLAEQGETVAQLNVGLMYLNGSGTNKNHHEAIRWLQQAAKKGNTDAMYHLGKYYLDSDRLDRPRGIKLIKQAAEQGQVEAQYRLGMLYYKGFGVIQDFEEGAKWILMAADRGMTDAMYQMGLLYLTGRGVDIDHIQSYVWFNIIAAQGMEVAVKQRDLLSETLNLDDLLEAQRRSRNFKLVSEKDTSDRLITDRDLSQDQNLKN